MRHAQNKQIQGNEEENHGFQRLSMGWIEHDSWWAEFFSWNNNYFLKLYTDSATTEDILWATELHKLLVNFKECKLFLSIPVIENMWAKLLPTMTISRTKYPFEFYFPLL